MSQSICGGAAPVRRVGDELGVAFWHMGHQPEWARADGGGEGELGGVHLVVLGDIAEDVLRHNRESHRGQEPEVGLGQLERDCSVVDRVQRRSSKTEGRRLSSGHTTSKGRRICRAPRVRRRGPRSMNRPHQSPITPPEGPPAALQAHPRTSSPPPRTTSPDTHPLTQPRTPGQRPPPHRHPNRDTINRKPKHAHSFDEQTTSRRRGRGGRGRAKSSRQNKPQKLPARVDTTAKVEENLFWGRWARSAGSVPETSGSVAAAEGFCRFDRLRGSRPASAGAGRRRAPTHPGRHQLLRGCNRRWCDVRLTKGTPLSMFCSSYASTRRNCSTNG